MFATIFAILILVLAGWAIAKNYDAKSCSLRPASS